MSIILFLLLSINSWIELESIPTKVEGVMVYYGDTPACEEVPVVVPRTAIGSDNKVPFQVDTLAKIQYVQTTFLYPDLGEGPRSNLFPTELPVAPVILKVGVYE